jgi:hypothetical protein
MAREALGMDSLQRVALSFVLWAASLCCNAADAQPAIAQAEVDAHVLAQFAAFGPLSKQHEYFGYVYLLEGVLASAVVRSPRCSSRRMCGLDTAGAARLVPARARVLAEWHTHPHDGSSQLSKEDVDGAHANRHISGYTPYYSTPGGEIYAWDPRCDWVPEAMASIVLIGNYRTLAAINGAETPDPTLRDRAARHVSRNASARVPPAAASSHRPVKDW